MEEITKKRVYYKGKAYFLIEEKTDLSEIQLESNPGETRLVDKKLVLSEEEYEHQKNNRLSNHVTW